MLMGRAPWEYICMNANPFFFLQVSPSIFKNVQNNKIPEVTHRLKSITNAKRLNHLQLNCASKELIKGIMCFGIDFRMAQHEEGRTRDARAPLILHYDHTK